MHVMLDMLCQACNWKITDISVGPCFIYPAVYILHVILVKAFWRNHYVLFLGQQFMADTTFFCSAQSAWLMSAYLPHNCKSNSSLKKKRRKKTPEFEVVGCDMVNKGHTLNHPRRRKSTLKVKGEKTLSQFSGQMRDVTSWLIALHAVSPRSQADTEALHLLTHQERQCQTHERFSTSKDYGWD